MNYDEAIAFLKARTKFGINLGLSRITELLNRVGNPHLSGMEFVHVTGTNGKGSTSAMLSSIFTAAGLKTGFFSSPHLHSYCERFRINNQLIKEEELAEILSELAPHLTKMSEEGFEPPTEFEISTAVALCYFAKNNVKMVVMEVGMGGSIDSTNVIPAKIAVITSVAMDHMDYLGNTLEEIATVKAGIIKESAIVVTPCNGSVLQVIKQKAQEQRATVFLMPEDFRVTLLKHDLQGQVFAYHGMGYELNNIFLPLLGKHQPINASLAISVALCLDIDEEHIRHGLAETRWCGRLELMSENPYIVLDGAHNVEGMEALAQAINDYFPQKRIIAVLGMLADKEREKAMAHLLPLLDYAVISRPQNERAKDWQTLAEYARVKGVAAECVEDIAQAVARGRELLQADDVLIISGSLYLVAAARDYLLEVL